MIKNVTSDVIEKTLEGLALRMEATSQNIANMNTPRYQRREVSFEDQLKEILDAQTQLPLKRSDPEHISNIETDVDGVEPQLRSVGYEVYRADLNNVDPETEIARLAETRMMYAAMALRMNGKFRGLRRVIGGGV